MWSPKWRLLDIVFKSWEWKCRFREWNFKVRFMGPQNLWRWKRKDIYYLKRRLGSYLDPGWQMAQFWLTNGHLSAWKSGRVLDTPPTSKIFRPGTLASPHNIPAWHLGGWLGVSISSQNLLALEFGQPTGSWTRDRDPQPQTGTGWLPPPPNGPSTLPAGRSQGLIGQLGPWPSGPAGEGKGL